MRMKGFLETADYLEDVIKGKCDPCRPFHRMRSVVAIQLKSRILVI